MSLGSSGWVLISGVALYACGNGVDLPHLAKRAFRDQIGAKSHAAWQSLSSRAEKLRVFSKKIHFLTIFLVFGDFFAVFLLLAIF